MYHFNTPLKSKTISLDGLTVRAIAEAEHRFRDDGRSEICRVPAMPDMPTTCLPRAPSNFYAARG